MIYVIINEKGLIQRYVYNDVDINPIENSELYLKVNNEAYEYILSESRKHEMQFIGDDVNLEITVDNVKELFIEYKRDLSNIPMLPFQEDINTLQKDNHDLLVSNFDLEYRVYEIEWFLEDNLQTQLNRRIYKGVDNMARSPYEQAKKIILTGDYDRVGMENKISNYLQRGVITKDEYDKLIALMDAEDLITI